MKKVEFVFLLLIFSSLLSAQEKMASLAIVEKVETIPVFILSEPVADYEVVGKAISTGFAVKIALNETSGISSKTKEIIQQTIRRKEKGKIGDFDAIIIDLYKEKSMAIKFMDKVSLEAKVKEVEGVPVYLYAKPIGKYKEIAVLDADFSMRAKRGLLLDKLESMMHRTVKKEENGEVGKFDAVIVNPEDLSEKLIVFE